MKLLEVTQQIKPLEATQMARNGLFSSGTMKPQQQGKG